MHMHLASMEESKDKKRPILFFFSSCLIIIIFFIRGQWIEGHASSFSYLIPLIAFLLFSYIVIVTILRGTILFPPKDMLLLFFIAPLMPLLSILLFNQTLFPSAFLSLELLLNFLVYYLFYFMISKGYLRFESVLYVIFFGALLMSIWIIFESVQLDDLRRFKGFPIGVNFLAHSLAVGALISVYFAFTIRRSVIFTSLLSAAAIINVLALFFTGSRVAMFGFLVALVILVLVGRIISWRILFTVFVLLTGIVLIIYNLYYDEGYQSLFARFDIDSMLAVILGHRIYNWGKALELISLESLLVGKAWIYELYGQRVVSPHNIFISILLYNGLMVLILFSYSIFKRLYHVFSSKTESYLRKAFMVSFLVIPLIYASSSGNYTRVFSIFLILGLIDGWFQFRNNRLISSRNEG